MTTTDTDTLTERIARTVHLMQDRIIPWSEESEVYKHDARKIAAAVLPIVAEEVRKAKAEALREAADEDFYDGDMDMPVRGYAELHWRADQIETGDSDEHR